MNEEDKKSLIAHILEQNQGEPPALSDAFEDALFAERIKDYLTNYFRDQDPAKYI